MSISIRHTAVLLAIAIAVACSTDADSETPSRRTNFQLIHPVRELWDEPLRDDSTIARIITVCCPRSLWGGGVPPPETKPACRELQRVIEQDSNTVGAFSNWGPNCYVEIPTASLLGALQRRVLDADALVRLLGVIDPSAEAHAVMFRELLKLEPPFNVDSADGHLISRLIDTLSLGGDQELALVAHALDSKRLLERQAAARVFLTAAQTPLELPGVLAALRALSEDSDPETARTARNAHISSKRHETELLYEHSHDYLVARLVTDPLSSSIVEREWFWNHKVTQESKLRAIQLLGRRLAFCSSRLATVALEAFRTDTDQATAYLAERAIALRARRCGPRLQSL
jgi:hypothetical protein